MRSSDGIQKKYLFNTKQGRKGGTEIKMRQHKYQAGDLNLTTFSNYVKYDLTLKAKGRDWSDKEQISKSMLSTRHCKFKDKTG